MLSQIRLSVCRMSYVTLVHPTQPVEIFRNFSSPYDSAGTLVFSCQNASEPQFRRSKVPGNNVVLSGVRVNAPSDPDKLHKLNKTNTTYRMCIEVENQFTAAIFK